MERSAFLLEGANDAIKGYLRPPCCVCQQFLLRKRQLRRPGRQQTSQEVRACAINVTS